MSKLGGEGGGRGNLDKIPKNSYFFSGNLPLGERGEHISNFEHFECRWTTLQKLGRCDSLNQACWISGNTICSGITTFPYVLVPKNKNTTRDGGRLDICNKILQLQFLRQKITPKNAYFATFANLQKKKVRKGALQILHSGFSVKGLPQGVSQWYQIWNLERTIEFPFPNWPYLIKFSIDHGVKLWSDMTSPLIYYKIHNIVSSMLGENHKKK